MKEVYCVVRNLAALVIAYALFNGIALAMMDLVQ